MTTIWKNIRPGQCQPYTKGQQWPDTPFKDQAVRCAHLMTGWWEVFEDDYLLIKWWEVLEDNYLLILLWELLEHNYLLIKWWEVLDDNWRRCFLCAKLRFEGWKVSKFEQLQPQDLLQLDASLFSRGGNSLQKSKKKLIFANLVGKDIEANWPLCADKWLNETCPPVKSV